MLFLGYPTILTVIGQRTSDRLLRGGRRALPGLFFACLVLAVYADPLFARRNFTGRDLPTYQLPLEKAVHDAWARGRLPVWIDEISGGRPLAPNPNAGVFYPTRPLLAPIPFAFVARLFPILHWIVAGLGMMILLRSADISRAGAWIGAATYIFSGVLVSLVYYSPYLIGAALLPWIVWTASRSGPRWVARTLTLAVLLGVDLLSGEPFTIALALAGSAIWLVAEERGQARRSGLTSLAAAVALAALLAAPQILATALWVPETRRAVSGMKVEEAIYFSLSPLRLLELLVPYPFGATWAPGYAAVWGQPVFHGKTVGLFATLYAGALGPIALFAAAASGIRGGRFARWFFGLSAAAAVLPSLVPPAFYSRSVPVALRFPEKFSIAIVFALAFLAGAAVDGFRQQPHRAGWILGVAAALAACAVAARLFPDAAARLGTGLAGSPPASRGVAALRIAPALVEGAILWTATAGALMLLALPSRGLRMAGLLVLTAVPLAANRRIARTARGDEVLSPTPFARFLRREDPDGRYRVLGESMYLPPSELEAKSVSADVGLLDLSRRHWYEYAGALWGRGTVLNVDFDSGDLSRVATVRELSWVAARYRDSEAFFGNLALGWGIRFRDQPPLAGFVRVGGDALQDWDRQVRRLPDVRLAERWVEAANGPAALEAMRGLSAGQIVLETGVSASGSAAPGEIRYLEKSPERLRLEVATPQDSWLFVLRGFWTHRSVRLDGNEAEVVPALIGFSGLRIPKGRHLVDWRERMPGAPASFWGPVLFVLAAAWLLVRDRDRCRRESGKRAPVPA